MIVIDLGTLEYFDNKKEQFVYENGGVVRFEYSLKAIYEWESKWRKPFLKGGLSPIELIDFYLLMALDPIKEKFMTAEVMATLSNYIGESHTATTFTTHEGQNGNTGPSKGKIYTAEEIYALMFMSGIPLEFENRNLNRLLTTLRIMGSYKSEPKKMAKNDIMKQNAQLNAERKKRLNTKG